MPTSKRKCPAADTWREADRYTRLSAVCNTYLIVSCLDFLLMAWMGTRAQWSAQAVRPLALLVVPAGALALAWRLVLDPEATGNRTWMAVFAAAGATAAAGSLYRVSTFVPVVSTSAGPVNISMFASVVVTVVVLAVQSAALLMVVLVHVFGKAGCRHSRLLMALTPGLVLASAATIGLWFWQAGRSSFNERLVSICPLLVLSFDAALGTLAGFLPAMPWGAVGESFARIRARKSASGNAHSATISKAASRAVRVFVSSTFRDMALEREALAKRAFPVIRQLCESRFVSFSYVDLRWGITDEQKAEGLVLPICLEEIEGCRPFFLGILGERYGWVPGPNDIADALLGTHPWLGEHRECSVTELEMIHGVVENPDMAGRSVFYFRDPGYLGRLDASIRPDFESEGEVARERLAALKDRIRSTGLPVREGYRTPEQLADLVIEDLTRAVNEEYPLATVPDRLTAERQAHEAYARERRGVYVGRASYGKALNDFVSGPDRVLLVTGESGSGKSALLADWVTEYRQSKMGSLAVIVEHFTGSSADAVNWVSMCVRLLDELATATGVKERPPSKPDELRSWFGKALAQCGKAAQVVLVIDGVDQLDGRDGSLDLAWLPVNMPEGVHVVLSAAPGRTAREAVRRGYQTLEVTALEADERRQLITDYLATYRKALSADLTERIVEADQSSNPLFVRVLLDELRLEGTYENLAASITGYLAATDVASLHDLVLERWERDYEDERPGLVRDTMRALAVSRFGLSELELLDVLGSGERPLARANFSPLFLAAKGSLVERSGLVGFAHVFMRDAAWRRYLTDKADEQAARRTLADYFAERDHQATRTLAELPWQLRWLQEFEALYKFVSDPDVLVALEASRSGDAALYWTAIERGSDLRAEVAYAPFIEGAEASHALRMAVANMLWNTDAYAAETRVLACEQKACLKHLDLRGYLVTTHFLALAASMAGDSGLATREASRAGRISGGSLGRMSQLLTLAIGAFNAGDLDGALVLCKQLEELSRKDRTPVMLATELGFQWCLNVVEQYKLSLAAALYLQGFIHYDRGETELAVEKVSEAVEAARAAGNTDLARQYEVMLKVYRDQGDSAGSVTLARDVSEGMTHRMLVYRAAALAETGDIDGSLVALAEAETQARRQGDRQNLAECLSLRANWLWDGEPDTAHGLFAEAEGLLRKSGDESGLADVLYDHACRLGHADRHDEALALLQEEEAICRRLELSRDLAKCLLLQALNQHERDDPSAAVAVLDEARRLFAAQGDKAGAGEAAQCLALRASWLWDDEPDSAHGLFAEAEGLLRESGVEPLLARALHEHADRLWHANGSDQALALLQEEEAICRRLGRGRDLASNLRLQARIKHGRDGLPAAVALLDEARLLFVAQGDKDGASQAAQCLSLHAGWLWDDDPDTAHGLLGEAEGLLRKNGDESRLSKTLHGHAGRLWRADNSDEAFSLLQEEEAICRRVERGRDLANCLLLQARIMRERHDLGATMALLDESELLFAAAGDEPGLSRVAGVREKIGTQQG